MNKFQAVVIGVSAGGFQALHNILPEFPSDFPLPVIIVQHRMETSDDFFIRSLNEKSKLLVKEAEDKEDIQKGIIYIAPAGYHLLIEKDKSFALSIDAPVRYSRPSIDVLFETAAEAFLSGLIGDILTGANNDGSDDIKKIKKNGGLTIAQEPSGAESKEMPLAAISTNKIDYILPLDQIPKYLINLGENK